MANSYLNIVTFLLTTLFYYLALKPSLTYDITRDESSYKNYVTGNYMYLAIYFLLVMIIQFFVNASVISSMCGGKLTDNMGSAGLLTFLPWTLIFGVVIIVLTIYPGFKSAFSDVIGYYYVSESANKILTELLVDKDIQKNIDADQSMSAEQKAATQSAADMIIKICGNTSILINQIVPSNFEDYWQLLTPLMKDKYKTAMSDQQGMLNTEGTSLKNSLFDLVVTRDNVGEAMWYIYTGLLLTSLVQLKIVTKGCASNPKTMEQNYQKFLESEKISKEKKSKATGTVYTITN
jgi:hypothetical protein